MCRIDPRFGTRLNHANEFGVAKVFAEDEFVIGTRMNTLTRWSALCVAAVVTFSGSIQAQDAVQAVPDSPAFEEVQPTLLDQLLGTKIAKKKAECKIDPLLKKAFAAADPKKIKGMAAKIRAEELDAKNRILAAQYLGTLDCQQFEEAQPALIALMAEDRFEEVRYQAVMSLRMMLLRGMRPEEDCNLCPCDDCKKQRKEVEKAREETEKAEKAAKKAFKPKPCGLCGLLKAIPKLLTAPLNGPKAWMDKKKNGPPEERRRDFCKGCCNEEVLAALSDVAYKTDDQGCPIEPSKRVREAARSALMLCPCCPADSCPEDGPVVDPLKKGTGGTSEAPKLDQTEGKKKATPPPEPTKVNSTSVVEPVINLASYASEKQPPLKALGTYCIVGLKERRFEQAQPDIKTAFNGRTYFFSSLTAKEKFVASPATYAPAYCGMDPVEYVKSGKVVEGTFLREFKGRFYLFASKAHWTEFQRRADELAVPAK